MDDVFFAVLWVAIGGFMAVKGVQLILLKGQNAERLKKIVQEDVYAFYCKITGICEILLGVSFMVFELILLFIKSQPVAIAFFVVILTIFVVQCAFSKKYTGSFWAGL